MIQYLTAYVTTACVFLLLDFVWLSTVAKRFYFAELGGLLHDKPKLTIAAAFYAVFVIGIVIFAVAPALQSGSLTVALLYGALFGFFTYATYDLTNYATLKNWSPLVTIVDIAWGTCLTAVSAVLGYSATRLILPG